MTRVRAIPLLALILLAGYSLTVAGSTAAAASPPAAVQYVALLQDSLTALTASPPDLVRARAPLVELTQGGDIAPPPFDPRIALQPVIEDLDSDPPSVSDATDRLQTLTAALRLPEGSVGPQDPSAASDTLRTVYRSSAFANLDNPPQPSWVQRLGQAVRDLLGRLGGGGGGSGGADHPLLRLVAAVIALALVVLVGVLLARSLVRRRAERALAEPRGATSDPDVEWTAALAAAARGDHREAVRRAFRSALLAVARRGRLAVDPTWTTRELLDRAAGDADLLAALAPAAAAFQVAWYSRRPVHEGDWELARSRCQTIRDLALRRVAARR